MERSIPLRAMSGAVYRRYERFFGPQNHAPETGFQKLPSCVNHLSNELLSALSPLALTLYNEPKGDGLEYHTR